MGSLPVTGVPANRTMMETAGTWAAGKRCPS
jgi:hypothetical protein